MSEAARDTAAGEVDSQTDDSKADGATVTPDVSGTVFADPEDFTIKHPLERECVVLRRWLFGCGV